MPWTSTGLHRSTNSSVKAPLPQPMSIHRKPDGGDSQARKIASEPAPYPHHLLIGGTVIEVNFRFNHLLGCTAHEYPRPPRASRLPKTLSSAWTAPGTRRAGVFGAGASQSVYWGFKSAPRL